MGLRATAGHPARGRVLVSRQVSWLAGRGRTLSSQRVAASVTSIGSNSLLTVAGAAPDFRATCAIHRLPS